MVLTAGTLPIAATGPMPPAEVAGASGASLPLGLQYAASETLGAADSSYAMTTDGDGHALSNATNAYSARVDAGGFAVSAGADSWSLTVAGVGYGADATPLGAGTAVASATANRVEYDYGAVSQWFVNGPLGLQQGFTLNQRPAGAAAGDPLSIDLALGGSLTATADPSGTSLSLTRVDGSRAMVYGGLTAYDADGAAVPARFAVDGDKVTIQVDDADAVYPLTVDPYVQQQKVTGSSAKPLQFFGNAVTMAASGTIAAISATASPPTSVRGSVYVFTTDGTTWSRVAELTSSDGAAGDEFGMSLAISADAKTLVVGARRMEVGSNANQGKVYVFRQGASPSSWTQVAGLTAADGAAGDFFGYSTAVSSDGSVIAVGAALADVGGAVDQGAAYVFTASTATTWTQTAKLTATDAGASATYGASIALNASGSLVAVGAPGSGGSEGAVYAYYQGVATKLTASGAGLGTSLATNAAGTVLVAGAPATAVGSNAGQGAAFVFTGSGAAWSAPTRLTASDGAAGDNLGLSVAIDANGATIALGAPGATVGASQSAGAAYVFRQGAGGAWTQAPRLTASDSALGARFGTAIAINDGAALAGAPLARSSTNGAAYFFIDSTPPNPPNLTVTSNPTSQTAAVGVPTIFTAAATSPAAITTQWQVSTDGTNWTDVAGATETWYSVTPTTGDSGKRYRAVFSDSDGGSATTTAAVLTVVKATTVLSIATSANPRSIGDPLTITVTAGAAGGVVAAGSPTGSVTLAIQRVGSANPPIDVGSAPLVNGQAVFDAPAMILGTYTITASYAGDSGFGAATATASQVTQRNSSALTAAVPSTAAVGQRVTLTATLTAVGGPVAMNGGVVVMDNGVPIGFPQTSTAGGATTATFVTPPLASGTHNFQFVFLGNPQLSATSTGVYKTQVGGSAPAAQAAPAPVLAAAAPGDAAAPAAQTAGTVTATAGAPTTLTAAATNIVPTSTQWQYRVQPGAAWINIPGADQAWYTFTPASTNQGWQYRATFSNQSGGSETSDPTTLNVAAGMAMRVSASVNPRPVGDPLTITGVASPAAPGVGPLAGGSMTVTVRPQGSSTVLMSFTGASGSGTGVFGIPTTLGVGAYDVTASYSDAKFGTVSSTTSLVVERNSSTLTAVVPSTAVAGQRLTLTATLTAVGGPVAMNGGVMVMDNGVPIGFPQTSTAGGVTTASFDVPSITSGTHNFQFVFLGNPQLSATSTGVYKTQVGGSPQAAPMVAAAPAASAAIDGVAIADALAQSSPKKSRTSSALTFWRGSL